MITESHMMQYQLNQMMHDRDYWRGKCQEVVEIMSAYEHTTEDPWIAGMLRDLRRALG